MPSIDYSKKKILVADLDGTLTVSKTPMDAEMQEIMLELLQYMPIAVISGGKYEIFQRNFVKSLSERYPERLARLYLFPTCGAAFYVYKDGAWTPIYQETLTQDEKDRIKRAFEISLKKSGYVRPEKTFGEIIEDRGTQITFSALGQQAPIELKSKWDPDMSKRMDIRGHMLEIIPDLEVRVGGTTSIDVTRKGIDKAYGIQKIMDVLEFGMKNILFIGDALREGGNDWPVKKMGVDCIQVDGPDDAKRVLREIIAIKKPPSLNQYEQDRYSGDMPEPGESPV